MITHKREECLRKKTAVKLAKIKSTRKGTS